MENSFKRFLSLALAIVMVLSNVPVQAFATDGIVSECTEHQYNINYNTATCTEPGVTYQECIVCHATTEQIAVSALGHDFGDNAEVCAVCKEPNPDYVAPHEHAWGEPVVVEATCDAAGSSTRTCSAEGCDVGNETTTIDALGHSYVDGICSRCQAKEPCDHVYQSVVTAVTCMEDGYTTYTCTKCSDSYVGDEVAAQGHPGADENGNCTVCGDPVPGWLANDGVIDTETELLDALAKGGTVELGASIEVTTEILIVEGNAVTLDLKTFTLTHQNIRNKGKLTIKNGTLIGTNVKNNGANAELYLEEIKSDSVCFGNVTDDYVNEITLKNCTLSRNGEENPAVYADGKTAVVIDGGTYTNEDQDDETNEHQSVEVLGSDSSLTIKNGTFNQTVFASNLTIQGGKLLGGIRVNNNSGARSLIIENGEDDEGNETVPEIGGTDFESYYKAIDEDFPVSITGGKFTTPEAVAFAKKYVAEGYMVEEDGDVVVDDVIDTAAELQAALDNGGEVVLGGNISTNQILHIQQKDVTLDLNGHNLLSTNNNYLRLWNHTAVLKGNGDVSFYVSIGNNANVTIEKGNYTNQVEMTGSGTLTINGGTFNKVSFNNGAAGASLTVSGGTFNDFGYDKKEDTNLTITGGTFNKDVTEYCAEGYQAVENGDGTYTVQQASYAAEVNGQKYATLQAAVEAVQNGQTIQLLDDIIFTEGANGSTNGISYTGGASFTLDLNGKTVTSNLGGNALRFKIGDENQISNTAVTITVKNGKVVSGSNNWCAISAATANNNKLTLNLQDLAVENSKPEDFAIKSWPGAVVKAEKVNVTSTNGGGFGAVGGEIELTDCTVTHTGPAADWKSLALGIHSSGKMTIHSGTYQTTASSNAAKGMWVAYVMSSGGTLEINGGTFNGTVAETAAATNACGIICADTRAIVNINGGTFNSNGAILDMRNNEGVTPNPKATLKGGTFSADPRVSGLYSSNLIGVAEGYTVKEDSGKFVVVEMPNVAQIGDDKYKSLQAAVDAGGNITVLENFTEAAVVTASKDFVLDLNGKTITVSQLKIPEGVKAEVKNGTIIGNTSAYDAVLSFGDLTLTDVNVSGLRHTVRIKSGTAVIDGGTYTYGGTKNVNATYHLVNVGDDNTNATVTIKSGTFTCSDYIRDGGSAVKVQNTSKVFIEGGTFSNNVYDTLKKDAKATLSITGGTFDKDPTAYLAAGYEAVKANGTYTVRKAATGTLGKCYIEEKNGSTRIYGEVTGMYANESVVVKLYSGETLVATTTLVKPEYLTKETLGVNFVFAGSASSSWNTVIEEGHPVAHMVPDKAVLHLDGKEKNTAVVTLSTIDDLGTPYVWGALTGVAPSPTMIGNYGYATLKEAFAAAKDGDTIKLHENFTIDTETYTIADGVSLTLDMNGQKITVTDKKVDKNANTGNYELFYIYGGLTVTGNGTIELSSSNDRDWDAMSTIFHNRGGVLTIENGTYANLGGTDMAFVVDNSGNYYGDATTNINGGTLTSTYTAVRNRMEQNSHGASGKAILNVSGGTINGTTSAIWAQAASTSTTAPATGEINISGGNIGLVNTARSAGAVSMTTISGGTVAGFKGEVGELKVTNPASLTDTPTILSATGEVVDYTVTAEGLYVQVFPVMIGTQGYTTLQAAVDDVQNGETITLNKDITEKLVTIEKADGLAFTIDGQSNKFTGELDIGIGEKLTIKNVNFVATAEISPDRFIDSMKQNSNCVLTIQNCTFTDTDHTTVAVGTQQPTSVLIDGCAANGVHSLLQNQGGYNITVENTTVNGARGMSLGTVVGATVDNVTINAADDKYGIRLNGEIANNTITIKNSKISAFIPVVVRKAQVENYSVVFEGTNTMTQANTDGYWCAIGSTEYEENGKLPTAASGKVSVTLNDTGLDIKGVYGFYAVAQIGDDKYPTLEAAADAAVSGNEIVLLDDVTLSSALTLPAGITLNGNGKQINGTIYAGGNLTFKGYTKIATFNAGYNKPIITIGEDACLETTSGRMVIGHGATFNITGSITNAKAANAADLTASLIAPGASFTGAGVNFNVTNAYVKFTSDCTSKNNNASGTFNFNVTNSIWDQTGKLAFEVPTAGKDPTMNLTLMNSVLKSTSHLVFAVTKGEIVIDNSYVNKDVAAQQMENRSKMTVKNGSEVYAKNATSSNAKNPGTLMVENATYNGSGEFSGADVGTGTLVLKNNAHVTLGTISKTNVTVDATSKLTATKVADTTTTTFTVDKTGATTTAVKVIDLSGSTSIESIVTVDGSLLATFGDDGDVTVSQKPVAKVGNTEYGTIDEAIANWTNNTTLTLLSDVTLSDVVTLKSTEHHILNLGTYTLTAAEGKNAFVIQACGTGDAERDALTINADATNPGGINAGSKCIVYYKYADGGISGNDRPIIKINGGVFTGSTSSWGTAGIYTIGTAARKCATLNISGGTFNCSINGSGKSKLIISGGTFNYSVGSQGDSTAYRLISGGTFSSIGFMTADANNTKFWIGTSMGNSNVGVHVDDNGYIVVGGPVITEPGTTFKASSANYSGASSYLQYSSAKDNGLYYTSVEEALADNKTTGAVTIYADKVDMTGITYTGSLIVPTDETLTVTFAAGTTPAWSVVGTNGQKVNYTETTVDGKVTRTYKAFNAVAQNKTTGTYFESVADALDAAQNGQTIELVSGETVISMAGKVVGGKTVTITGTAIVDWTKGNLWVGREGAGDGKVIFDGANITSFVKKNVASTGIHVSGSKKNDANTNNGVLVIKDSNIELDYLINRNETTVEGNSTLTIYGGIYTHGRDASESASGTDETATLTIGAGSTVNVINENGMGVGGESYGIMTVSGTYKANVLNIQAGSAVEVNGGALDIVGNVNNNGTLDVNGGTVKTAATLTNKGTVYVTGTSDIAANVTGEGWVYMNGVNLDADTKLNGAKVAFINGTNNVVGSEVVNGFFSVGVGQNAAADTAAAFAEAKGITLSDVTVNVSGDAVIGDNGAAYSGWVGSAYSADKTQNKYVLNIENSLATFGYMHVSKDGELNVKGHSTNKYTYDNANVDFYAGDFIINGTVTMDSTDAWGKFVKMSVDAADGVLNLVNTKFEASVHNGSNTSTSLKFWKAGKINVDATSEVEIDNGTVLVEGAELNIAGDVTAKGAVTGNGTITLTEAGATFAAAKDLNVVTSQEDYKVAYVDGAYKLIAKVYVAEIEGGKKYESLAEALAAAAESTDANVMIEILGNVQETVTDKGAKYAIPENGHWTIYAAEGKNYTVTLNRNGETFSLYQMSTNSSLTIAENITIEGLDIVANGFYTTGNNTTINGTIKAESLKQWTSNGTITVTETGKVELGYGDGQFDMNYGSGSVTITGTGDKTAPQFKAGYTSTQAYANGNILNLKDTFFEGGSWFKMDGTNGTINVDNALLKVSGGDAAGRMTIASSGNTVNLTNGSELAVNNLSIAAGNSIKLDSTSKINGTSSNPAKITGAGKIIIDATGMTAGEVTAINADISGFTGTVEAINNNAVYAEIVDGKIVLSGYVAMIGEQGYKTLEEALANVADWTTIKLVANATLYYGAREAYGRDTTTDIIIDGQGFKLTLNQTDSDWGSIGMKNAAGKLTLKNMTINKGANPGNGAWNNHAIIFSSNVEMKDVIVNNAIAVQNGATLNNVTINEAGEYYGLWINGNGQTVIVNGGAINATNGGRGIKIADQYIDAPESVTLNVTGTKFNTAKKAAVLVSSKAGADITASDANIENVAADKVNFAWVDEDRGAYYNQVTVNDKPAAQESVENFFAAVYEGEAVVGYHKTLQAAVEAAKAGDIVTVLNAVELDKTLEVKAPAATYAMRAAAQGITLDLNGKTISMEDSSGTACYMIKNLSVLTIMDSSEAKTGKLTLNSTTPTTNNSYAVSTIGNGGTLIIESGTVENTTNGSACYAIDNLYYTSDVSLTINGGKIIGNRIAIRQQLNTGSTTAKNVLNITGGEIVGGTAAVQTHNYHNAPYLAEVNIGGGTLTGGSYAYHTSYSNNNTHTGTDVEITGGTFNGTVYIYNSKAGSSDAAFANVAVKGGEFNGDFYAYTKDANGAQVAIPAITGGTYAEMQAEAYLAAGYALKYNAVSRMFNVVDAMVASVNGVEYNNLTDAIAAATAQNGATIYLKRNVTLQETLNVASGAKFTLNMMNYTLTGSILAPSAEITIENGSIKNTNKNVSAIEINAGKLTLNDVNIESARHAVRIDGASANVEAIINGGEYKVTGAGSTQHAVNVSKAAKVTINDGTFIGPKGTTADSGSAVNVQAGATVTINGGDFSGGKNSTLASSGTLTVIGGTYDQDPSAYVAEDYKAVKNADNKFKVVEKVYVAMIGEVGYESVAEALTAAQSGATIKLISGKNVISMAGSVVGGKTVTITGTAIVDWTKGNLWIGREGVGDGKVIFDNATITSSVKKNHASTGIHVSGSKASDAKTNNGTLVIKDSNIELDYLINRNATTVEGNSTLTIYGGIYTHGRDASESASGTDETATLTIGAGSTVNVINENGMGVGGEGNGIMNVNGTYKANVLNVSAKGIVNIAGSAEISSTVKNNGSIVLTDVGATLTASECDNVTTDVADYKVIYENGAYKLAAKVYVAQIGETGYESIQAAIDAAQNDETVTLLKNINLAEIAYSTLDDAYDTCFKVEGKSITVDMNGKEISGEYSGTSMLVGVFSTDNNGHLTLTGNGTVDVTATGKVYSLIANYEDGCAITIQNGTYELDEAVDSLIYSGSDCDENEGVTVNGGTFTLGNVGDGTNGKPWIFNTFGGNANNVVVNGGTFNADVAHQFWANEVYIPENLALKNNGNGTWTIDNAVAYIAETADSTASSERKVGYATLADAFEAAAKIGGTVTMIKDIELSETVTVAAGKSVTLDLNGKTIAGTDNNTSGNFYLINNTGKLTIEDSIGTGKINLTATNDTGWNRSSVVVANNPGGELIVNGGIIDHLGGHTMAYGIDNLTNGKGTSAVTTINGGTVNSAYIGIRQFLNGVEATNTLTINGGTVTGKNSAIYFQDPSVHANSGKLIIGETAVIGNRVYLDVTEGSTQWPVEVSISVAAMSGNEVKAVNVPAGYAVVNDNGIITVQSGAAMIGTAMYKTLAEAITAVEDGQTITLLAGNAETVTIKQVKNKSFTIDGNGNTMTGTINIDGNNGYTRPESLTIQNINFVTEEKAHIFINANNVDGVKKPNSHNVTVKKCTFTGPEGENQVQGMAVRMGNNITFENCTATNVMYLVQSTSAGLNLTVKDSKITGIYGIRVHNGDNAKIQNVTLNISNTGIIFDGGHTRTATLENVIFTGTGTPIFLNKAGSGSLTLNMNGTNTLAGDWFNMNTTGANVKVVKNDAALDVSEVNELVVSVGNVYYNGLPFAIEENKTAEEVTYNLLTATELAQDWEIANKVTLTGEALTIADGKVIKLTAETATLTASEDLKDQVTTTDVADYKVVYEAGTYKLVKKIYVAQISETQKFETLAEAIAAVKNGETITLRAEIAENVTIKQKANKSFTIDGAGMTMTGKITVLGRNAWEGKETLTIKNINFKTDKVSHDFITLGSKTTADRYPINVTVDNCTFTGNDNQTAVRGIVLRQARNTTVTNCDANKVFNLLNNTSGGEKLTVKGGTINAKYGINANNMTGEVVIEDVTINATVGYAIALNNVIKDQETVVSNCKIDSGYVDIRGDYVLTIDGTNTVHSGTWLKATNDGNIKVIMKDANLDMTKTEGLVANIDNIYYNSLQNAVNDAENGATVQVFKDHEIVCNVNPLVNVAGKVITIDLNGKKITANAVAGTNTRFIFQAEDSAELTLTDSVGGGTVVANGEGVLHYMFRNAGKMTIAGGNYELSAVNGGAMYYSLNNNMVVNGGMFTQKTEGWMFNTVENGLYKITVEGGTFNRYFIGRGDVVPPENPYGEVVLGEGKALVESEIAGYWTIAEAVAQNVKTGVTFQTVDAALSAAKSGETVIILKDTASAMVMVPAGITLDLNGKNYTVNVLVSFGDIVDGEAGGNGTLKATGRLVLDSDNNAGFLPIGIGDNTYELYAYSIVNMGAKSYPGGAKYGHQIQFENAAGYERLKNTKVSGVRLYADIKWDDMDAQQVAECTMLSKTVIDYCNAILTTPRSAMTVYVSGLDNLETGKNIYSAFGVESELTGYSFLGEALAYTVQ